MKGKWKIEVSKRSTEDSWHFFRLLNMETDFLQKDEKDWSLDEEYLKRKKRANMITVVNDCPERGTKSLATDFNHLLPFKRTLKAICK